MADAEMDRQAALASAIGRAAGSERVDFPLDDPGFVYVQSVEPSGEPVLLRYRLSPEAQQFLSGEFPELPDGGLSGWLYALRGDERL